MKSLSVFNWIKRFFSLSALYEGAFQTRNRARLPLDSGNADYSIMLAGKTLTEKARYFDANYDYATGATDVFEASVVGEGIISEPLVLRKDGTPHREVNLKIKALYKEFMRCPGIDGTSGSKLQRLACRSYFVDGEIFIHFFEGKQYPHFGKLPLSIELIEMDQLPISSKDSIVCGVEKNKYGAPVSYHFTDVTISAHDVLHLKLIRRPNQTRGVSKFHAVVDRLQDIKDIDNYERIASKMGAAIGLKIERTSDYSPSGGSRADIQEFYPGMVLDGLDVGERAEMLNPNSRPNPQLEPFRDSQLRAAAAGLGISASSLMRKYTGTYSSERQALTESQRLLKPKIDDFINDFVDPVYRRVLSTAILYQLINIPWKEINKDSLFNVSHKGPTMPWIDPLKEIMAKERMVQGGFDSKSNQIRSTGRDPDDVLAEIAMDAKKEEMNHVRFTTSADGIPNQ